MGKALDAVLDVVTVDETWQNVDALLFLLCDYCVEKWASIGMGGLSTTACKLREDMDSEEYKE